MGSTRALLLAGAVALGVANAAQAADLPPPPLLPTYVPGPEPVVFSGWYIRGDVGAGLTMGPDLRSGFYDKTTGAEVDTCTAISCPFGRDRQKIGDVGFVDFGVGYQFNNWLRFDATGEVRSEAKFSTTEHYSYDYLAGAVPGQLGYDNYNGSVQSSVFLVNGYVDLGTWYGMTPYIGGGVGAVYNHMSALTDTNPGSLVNFTDGSSASYGAGAGGFAAASGKWNLAYAGMAGFSYSITQNLKLDIGYRYLDMGDVRSGNIVCIPSTGCGTYERQKLHLSSNDIRIGLRWLISDYAPLPPPPPEMPIIRKD